MRSRAALGFSLLFFLSGATGLVYQLLWVRVLYQSFGSTIQSVTTVVAAYMGGLGLGAWWLGRYADRHRRPAALYGWLELAIGGFGVVSPAVLALAHRGWIAMAGALPMGPAASVGLRFGLAAAVLAVPTTLMGATLPVLTRAFTGRAREALQPELARLYGLNTLGAVVGTALAGVVLIEHLGIRVSLWLTALVNVALGAGAIVLARRTRLYVEPSVSENPAPAVGPSRPPVAIDVRHAALALLAVTAFAGLLNEIAWTRVLVMIVGGSTYAFTLVLAVFLLGIGLGSAVVAWSGRGPPEPAATAATAAVAQGIAAAGAALLLLALGALPRYIITVFQIPGLEATGRLAWLGAAVACVVLLPAIGMGMTFPLLTELAARRDEARSADVGRAYALNTVGSICGAVLTGFVLVVALGSDRTLRLGVLVSAAAALVLAWLSGRGVAENSTLHRRLRLRVIGGGALAAAAFAAALATPGWDTRLIDLGPTIYGRDVKPGPALDAFLAHRGARQLAFREGRNATVSVWESDAGRVLKVNGKADASDHGDMDTQVMLGLAPLVARAGATSALVIGYGSGATARVLAAAPGMQTLQVVELEPAVLEMDSLFRSVNDNVLGGPGVRVVADDARSALQLQTQRFDIVVSEPSNPWVAGIATLYTPEFFRIVRARLAPDGVFCQWIQLYQLPLPVIAGITANVRAVFPHVEMWFGSPYDVLLLASGRPLRYDDAWLDRLLGPGGAFAAVAREWLGVDGSGDYFGRSLLQSAGIDALVQGRALEHSDDHPRLEFVAARRFLDGRGTAGLFDSLVVLGARSDVPGPGRALLLAKALATRPGAQAAWPYIEGAFEARPRDPAWALRAARSRLARGDTSGAEAALEAVLGQGHNPEAMLLTGLIAVARQDRLVAHAVLREALGGGADTAASAAGLALLAARERRWTDAAAAIRMMLGAPTGTFRHPVPHDLVVQTLTQMALEAPADTARRLVEATLAQWPGWARLYELRAVAALRSGNCDAAVEGFLTLLQFGFRRPDGPELVRSCRAGVLD